MLTHTTPHLSSHAPPLLYIQAPSWAYLLCAVGLFVYQALDATDGKQARRTNSSSPLGELFDHGCDSVSTGWWGVGGYNAKWEGRCLRRGGAELKRLAGIILDKGRF